MALILFADAAPSGVLPALIGAVATIAVGLLALAGVRWTSRQQGRIAENERKLSLFEEQDRLLEQNRRETDRAYQDRDYWRDRALAAEQREKP